MTQQREQGGGSQRLELGLQGVTKAKGRAQYLTASQGKTSSNHDLVIHPLPTLLVFQALPFPCDVAKIIEEMVGYKIVRKL